MLRARNMLSRLWTVRARITRIGNTIGELSSDADATLGLSKQQCVAVRCQSATTKRGRHFPAMDGWKRKREMAIVRHGDRGGSCPV
jgi:hypothetical protein